jgi:hypothetical protein
MQFCGGHDYPTRCSALEYGSPTVARIPTSSLDLIPFIGDDEKPGRPATGDLLPARPVSEAGPLSSSDERERLSHRAGFSRLLCLPGVRRRRHGRWRLGRHCPVLLREPAAQATVAGGRG